MGIPARLLALLLSCLAGCAQPHDRLALPPRPADAPTGSELAASLAGLSTAERERVLWQEITSGNVPSLLRQLVPVTTTATIQGRLRSTTFWCTPDYLGVGSDGDWFRLPMTPGLAQRICDHLQSSLPTRHMVNAIWAAAAVQLPPSPISPDRFDIESLEVLRQHHLQIERQRRGPPHGLLTAGIKKDTVVSALIADWPDRVCIYGWHRQDGSPIQPLSKIHSASYLDYSHGVRLIAERILVDGQSTTLASVLADPILYPLLSDEGPFTSHRYPSTPP